MSTNNSQSSLAEATRSRAAFSGHGGALGAAGKRQISLDPDNALELQKPGQSLVISPPEGGFSEEILIGAAWDPITAADTSWLGKLLKRTTTQSVDLDLGCLYELEDGTRGAIQAFGEKFGNYDDAPFIALSGDARSGEEEGNDETLHVNGTHWDKVKRMLVYLYIYKGVANWAAINRARDPRCAGGGGSCRASGRG